MGIFQTVRDLIMNLFKSEAEEKFKVDIIRSGRMEMEQIKWAQIIDGKPPWLDPNDGIVTINFAKFISYYTAKKICLDINVKVEGSERAKYIQKCIKSMIQKSIRDKVEDACNSGGIIFKPNGNYLYNNAIDYVMPGDFAVTEKNSNGEILGIIFIDRLQKGDNYYTRLEHQHFVTMSNEDGTTGRVYSIENKAFRSNKDGAIGKEIPLTMVDEWKDIQPELLIDNVEKPLFGYFKMPYNNTIDYNSPEGVAVFHNCLQELKALDIAFSRKSDEVDDSKHLTFIDEKSMKSPADKEHPSGKKIRLPRFVKGLRGGLNDEGKSVSEHVATMLTEQRIADINSILSLISTKCGFSQGQFILDRKTGRITATQVESDDSETVETITDMRTNLKSAIIDLIYALDKYCDVFFDMPSGYVNVLDENVPEEDIFYFRDLLTTFEQDRDRAYKLMTSNVYSKIKYLTEYEGFSKKEAEEMLAEAQKEKKQSEMTGLFKEDE